MQMGRKSSLSCRQMQNKPIGGLKKKLREWLRRRWSIQKIVPTELLISRIRLLNIRVDTKQKCL